MRPALPENDCNDRQWAVCEGCDHAACCDRNPSDCEADAREEAAEARFEGMRDCYD